MTTPVSQEVRSQIIASIKGGTPIVEAAEAHGITPSTIRKWMQKLSGNAHPTTNEVQKLKKHIDFLEHVVLNLALEQKAQTHKG